MREPIITRALLGHYLRAVAHPASREEVLALEHGLSTHIITALAAESLRADPDEIKARLGVCWAVERLLKEAADNFDDETEAWKALRREAHWYLTSIDVDPKRWEEARNG